MFNASFFTALFDACVLYPAPLRDLLINLGMAQLFRAKWTNEIHEEWMRSLLEKRPDLKREKLERTRDLINASTDDCLVEGYEALIEALELPDPGDRHVLAAAIRGRADIIVTFNLKDFPSNLLEPYQIDVQHPDEFVAHLIDLDEIAVCKAVKKQRENLRNPTKTPNQLLDTLHKQGLPISTHRLRDYIDLI